MKFDVVEFVSICLTCQKVKTDHPRPQGLLHQLHIPERKWKSIFMDFLCGFLRKPKGNNMILVIVERLKKVAHFITMKDTWSKHQPLWLINDMCSNSMEFLKTLYSIVMLGFYLTSSRSYMIP